MKFLVLGLLAASTASACTRDVGSIEQRSLYSKSLGAEKRYTVYLPRGYSDNARRYPTLYFLHPLTGSETSLTALGNLKGVADSLGLEMIVVMPDGDDSFYVNAKSRYDYDECLRGLGTFSTDKPASGYCVTTPRYEDYLVTDLIGEVDSSFRTLPEREARGIAGMSMGGFGALALSLRHSELFSVAVSHSGVASLLYSGPFPYVSGQGALTDTVHTVVERSNEVIAGYGSLLQQVFGPEITNYRDHEPALLLEHLRHPVTFYLDVGDEDRYRSQDAVQFFVEKLQAKNIEHEWHLVEGGGHGYKFLQSRLPHSLKFARKQLARPR